MTLKHEKNQASVTFVMAYVITTAPKKQGWGKVWFHTSRVMA
jgi:hypothetical protein